MRKTTSIFLAVLLVSCLFVSCDPEGNGGGNVAPENLVGTWKYTRVIGPDTDVWTIVMGAEGDFVYSVTHNGALADTNSGTYSTSGGYWIGNVITDPAYAPYVGDVYMYVEDNDSTHKYFAYDTTEATPDPTGFLNCTWDGDNTLTYASGNSCSVYEISSLASPATVQYSWTWTNKDGSGNILSKEETSWTADATPLTNVSKEIGKYHNQTMTKATITNKYSCSGDSLVMYWYDVRLELTRQ